MTPRYRRLALAVVLFAQSLFFVALLPRPLSVDADNIRYEVAGYHLSIGRGLSMPLSVSLDSEVYHWVCDRHPEACSSDGNHPNAIYPPGYSIFIGGVYALCGHSLAALAVAHWLLLMLLFVIFERLAAHLLDGAGYTFAMGVAATYPFLARQATLVMADHLHAVLFGAALASLVLLRPGLGRGVLFALLMSLASLVRPYSLLVFPILWLWPAVWRGTAWRQRLLVAVVFFLPFAAWTARNAYWFGRFVPISTGGAGINLVHSTLEWEKSRYSASADADYYTHLQEQIGGYETMSYEGNRRLVNLGLSRIRQHPFLFAGVVATHIPKLWISLGTAQGVSRAWPLLVLYLGGLWLLGLVGGWWLRRDERWAPLLIAIGVYWLFLLYTPGEARRTLALRLPMLLCGAAAFSRIWARRRSDSSFALLGEKRV